MIPALISWTYHREDIDASNQHGIATGVFYTERDIPIKEFIPNDCDKFMLFIIIIFQSDSKVNILSCIKTHENISEIDKIPPGCYYGYYLVPSYYKVMTNCLRVTDKDNTDLYIEINCQDILNDQTLNLLTFPKQYILFNN